MDYSTQFLRAFISAYKESKNLFSREGWERVWNIEWNNFMLWNCRHPQVKPVLELAAENMGLKYWDREPFRVDAVFVKKDYRVIGNLPIPLVVAIEHELTFRCFIEEVTKLIHVRCPLKVGISYAKENEGNRIFEWITEISKYLETIEDPKTEYLYLLGEDTGSMDVKWHAWTCGIGSDGFFDKWAKLTSEIRTLRVGAPHSAFPFQLGRLVD